MHQAPQGLGSLGDSPGCGQGSPPWLPLQTCRSGGRSESPHGRTAALPQPLPATPSSKSEASREVPTCPQRPLHPKTHSRWSPGLPNASCFAVSFLLWAGGPRSLRAHPRGRSISYCGLSFFPLKQKPTVDAHFLTQAGILRLAPHLGRVEGLCVAGWLKHGTKGSVSGMEMPASLGFR